MARKAKKTEATEFALTIQGDEWTVRLVEGPIIVDGIGRVSGYCDADPRIIVLEANEDKDWLRRVFGHEFVHAALSAVSVNGLRGKDGYIAEEIAAEIVGRAYNELMVQAHLLPGWVTNRKRSK